MLLELEPTVVPAEGRQRVPKAVKWVPIVGKGFSRAGQVVWRAVRRSGRRKMMGNLPAGSHTEPQGDQTAPGIPFWSVPAWDLGTPALFSVSGPPPDWLPGPLRQLLWPFDTSATAGQQEHSSAEAAGGGGSRASRRRERRAARQQRRAYKRVQKQLQKASKAAAAAGPALPSTTTSLLLDADFGSSRPGMQDAAVAAPGTAAGGGWGTHVLAQMINPANTFPMLLHSAKHLQEQQQHQDGSETDGGSTGQLQPRGESTSNGSSSSSVLAGRSSSSSVLAGRSSSSSVLAGRSSSSSVLAGRSRPQQLLTVGCRHWGNGMVQGLLRVKIYDFAIYLDGQQAQAHLPATPLMLEASDSQLAQQQQQQQSRQQMAELGSAHDLPAVLKSSSTQVDMSLVLKAARDVPLHLLSAEYEKVLRRRLDRVGGSSEDITALQQLLASFSDARRLPAAVTASSGSSSRDTQLPAPGAGGSVRKGAMIVFERNRAGDVTARVGPVILGTVSSPKVAEALFDLYLGDQPVSKTAKDAAAQTLRRLAASTAPDAARGSTDSPSLLQAQEGSASGSGPQSRQQQLAGYYLPDSKGQEIQCEGQEGRVGGRRGRRKKGAAGGGSSRAAAVAAGLDVDDLDACVLHMG